MGMMGCETNEPYCCTVFSIISSQAPCATNRWCMIIVQLSVIARRKGSCWGIIVTSLLCMCVVDIVSLKTAVVGFYPATILFHNIETFLFHSPLLFVDKESQLGRLVDNPSHGMKPSSPHRYSDEHTPQLLSYMYWVSGGFRVPYGRTISPPGRGRPSEFS